MAPKFLEWQLEPALTAQARLKWQPQQGSELPRRVRNLRSTWPHSKKTRLLFVCYRSNICARLSISLPELTIPHRCSKSRLEPAKELQAARDVPMRSSLPHRRNVAHNASLTLNWHHKGVSNGRSWPPWSLKGKRNRNPLMPRRVWGT